ncbi:MAG: hypothetical protein HY721_12960 [Planctomycetes bacterium]|nr:hypothetical protein [Planctomycetota bacterium]
MTRRRVRLVAWACGLGIAAVGAVAAANWRRIAVRWLVRELERDRGAIVDALERPEGSLARAALDEHLRTPAGKEALFRSYADLVLKSVLPDEGTERWIHAIVWTAGARASFIPWDVSGSSRGPLGYNVKGCSPAAVPALRSLLPRLEGTEHTLDGYPDFTFRILELRRALEAAPHVGPAGHSPQDPAEPVCLIELEPSRAVAVVVQLLSSLARHALLEAAQALGRMGPRAREALPALRALITPGKITVPGDSGGVDDSVLQVAVRTAIARIEGAPEGKDPIEPASWIEPRDDEESRSALFRVLRGLIARLSEVSPVSAGNLAFRYLLGQCYEALNWINPHLAADFEGVMHRHFFGASKSYAPPIADAWVVCVEAAGGALTGAERDRVRAAVLKAFDVPIPTFGDDASDAEDEARVPLFRAFVADLRAAVDPGKLKGFETFLREIHLPVRE